MTQPSINPTRPRVFIIGTRAQLIKVAPVIVECEKRDLVVRLLLTGQHQETMDDLIREFGIASSPEPVLRAKERSSIQSLMRWAPKACWGMRKALAAIRSRHSSYDVLVHGDTLSTLLGAFVGRLCGARILHLESGLTSGRLLDPFPEELFRRLVFRLSDVAFCPDEQAAAHMRTHYRCEVLDTRGNTVTDAVHLSGVSRIRPEKGRPRVVMSIHRFQNIFNVERLGAIVKLVTQLAGHFDIHFVLHPATRKRLDSTGLMADLRGKPGVKLSPRLGYREFISLASAAACVLTDGGSNQEELAVLGVPTVVMRERTERADGLGRNAIMEADITGGVLGFLIDGAYESLRTPAIDRTDRGPSARIAEYLQRAEAGHSVLA